MFTRNQSLGRITCKLSVQLHWNTPRQLAKLKLDHFRTIASYRSVFNTHYMFQFPCGTCVDQTKQQTTLKFGMMTHNSFSYVLQLLVQQHDTVFSAYSNDSGPYLMPRVVK